jgi:hypothetical protein
MEIEIQFNSVMMDMKELQEHFPELLPMIQSSLPQKKKTKRRKRKKKKTVANLIDEILNNINSE